MKKNTTLTIGMDIGDRKCHVVVLAGNDEDPTETTMIKTTRESMQSYFVRITRTGTTQSADTRPIFSFAGAYPRVTRDRVPRSLQRGRRRRSRLDRNDEARGGRPRYDRATDNLSLIALSSRHERRYDSARVRPPAVTAIPGLR